MASWTNGSKRRTQKEKKQVLDAKKHKPCFQGRWMIWGDRNHCEQLKSIKPNIGISPISIKPYGKHFGHWRWARPSPVSSQIHGQVLVVLPICFNILRWNVFAGGCMQLNPPLWSNNLKLPYQHLRCILRSPRQLVSKNHRITPYNATKEQQEFQWASYRTGHQPWNCRMPLQFHAERSNPELSCPALRML